MRAAADPRYIILILLFQMIRQSNVCNAKLIFQILKLGIRYIDTEFKRKVN